ncbi:hypothetical protein SERLA73DRAFT_183848 [Serpula lacrymans var. lacrymans S7.3]|uniref:DUF952 domain-containing protein n=2 Tax=Serpula lacrymans var. lacrymans TaxID=341189 RepID=F8Q1Y1_SERL3|nr:uncharacterized protein SERLADRAFT_471238 [Serpula lacrymans var. lacrymans S7.9]EGN97192.1 hypothetical protein SERLA73DRAFT_183848 [Serpula lacrymans var. lacrymans S7.3]EGO22800.1 hypothetical protein SERLADRAFT_471238 [Serpula lacrymans var. lacrymans S7.9]
MSKPTYVYKLISSTSAPPDPLPERLPVSTIDETSGFVHLSTAVQVPGTLKYFFAEDRRVYILRIPYDEIEKNIRWEDPKAEICGPRGGEGMFPHLYNGLKLGRDEVESVAVWEKGDEWDAALLKAENWLVY